MRMMTVMVRQYLTVERVACSVFFIGVLLIGVFSFRDFGIPYDEATMTELGEMSYQYVFSGKPYTQDTHIRFHGTTVELPLRTFFIFFGPFDPQTMIFTRHAVVFVFFFIAIIFLYLIGKRITGDWRIALIGCVFLLLSPRVFAHAFYNSRDIPNLSLFTVAIWTMLKTWDRGTKRWAALHGIVMGLDLGLRMTAVFLPVLTLMFITLRVLRREWTAQKAIILFLIALITLVPTTIAVWPLLWEHPIKHIVDAYHFMSSFDPASVTLGQELAGLRWYYVPMWIGITTPLLYSTLALVGAGVLVYTVIQSPRHILRHATLETLLPLVGCLAPILALMLTGAGIYQEWRHMLFVYPCLLLLSECGILAFLRFLQRMGMLPVQSLAVCIGILLMQIVPTAWWMVRNHPHDYVYYSVPGTWLPAMRQMDYWGLSTRYGVSWILENDKRSPISYYSPDNITYVNGHALFPNDRKRLQQVKSADFADYLIQLHKPEMADAPSFEGYHEVFSVVVDEEKLTTVYEGSSTARSFMDTVRSTYAEDK